MFTSDLSVSEYVLLGEAGFEPLGFVIGSSIYHIGIQVGKWSQNQELQVLTQAMYNARELAMARMQAEAEHLGADGIVGVQLRMQAYVWGQDVLEFLATGTAVKAIGSSAGSASRLPTVAPSPPISRPRISSASWPAGQSRSRSCSEPASTTSPTSRLLQALRQTGQNQEMVKFTQGIYEARELALSPNAGRSRRRLRLRGSSVSASASTTTSGASTPPSSSPPARPSAGSATSTGSPDTSPKPTFTLGLDI